MKQEPEHTHYRFSQQQEVKQEEDRRNIEKDKPKGIKKGLQDQECSPPKTCSKTVAFDT